MQHWIATGAAEQPELPELLKAALLYIMSTVYSIPVGIYSSAAWQLVAPITPIPVRHNMYCTGLQCTAELHNWYIFTADIRISWYKMGE
jgi:hypothetical protein